MGTTSKQDRDFAEWVIPGSFLEDAIEWIRKNMEPEDVFGLEKLSACLGRIIWKIHRE